MVEYKPIDYATEWEQLTLQQKKNYKSFTFSKTMEDAKNWWIYYRKKYGFIRSKK